MSSKYSRVVADGISLVEPKAFQSFVTRVYAQKLSRKIVIIPNKICCHLHLEKDDIIEIAVRKVTKEYAKEAYNRTFWSFKVTCPKCGEIGTLCKRGKSFGVWHYREGGHLRSTHYLQGEQANNLIVEHELAVGVLVSKEETKP